MHRAYQKFASPLLNKHNILPQSVTTMAVTGALQGALSLGPRTPITPWSTALACPLPSRLEELPPPPTLSWCLWGYLKEKVGTKEQILIGSESVAWSFFESYANIRVTTT